MLGMNTRVIGATAAVVLVIALAILIRELRPAAPQGVTEQWFYDLNTGQLFAATIGEIPPIAAPSGPLSNGDPAGVRAHVYACGDCSPATRTIAYLETYTAAQRDQLRHWHDRARRTEPEPDGQRFTPNPEFFAVLSGQAALVKRPDDADWVVRGSPEGLALTTAALPVCGPGISPQECRP